MKSLWTCLVLAVLLHPGEFRSVRKTKIETDLPATGNLFIITTDGYRWQELFNGADSFLINSDDHTPDKETIKALYWAETIEERRKKLMPFFWNVISNKGQLYGNRQYNNKVNTSNLYSISYPGYNELFTGDTDPSVSSNGKYYNPNINVLEYLDALPEFKGRVAAFTSWDVFPYILNEKRNDIVINSGYENMNEMSMSSEQLMINKVQDDAIAIKTATRFDELTFLTAKEYINNNRPRVVYLGFGETDEFAHQGRYDLYLQQANAVDKMIADLWHWVQTTPGYKDNTTFIITTDHGRGRKTNRWTGHGEFISGSSQAWFAIIGPGIAQPGEIKANEQYYQVQMAGTIAALVGEDFNSGNAVSLR
jgi:Type I phosphodiesterase / nucleotide pyrophosphatase